MYFLKTEEPATLHLSPMLMKLLSLKANMGSSPENKLAIDLQKNVFTPARFNKSYKL